MSRFRGLEEDLEAVEEWVEEFFARMMGMFTAFFANLSLPDAVASMEALAFGGIVEEQLAGEPPEVIAYAVRRVAQLQDMEVARYRAYQERA